MADLTLLHDPNALAHADAFAFVQSTTFEDLPDDAKAYIDQKFIEQHYLKHRQHEFKKLNFDRDEAVTVWLNLFDSPHTRRRYTAGIADFFRFLDEVAKVHVLDLDADTADRYIAYVGLRFKATATQNNYINVASAFCKQLVRRKDLQANYFAGATRPAKQDAKVYHVPKDHEVNAILALTGQSRARWAVPALRFMLRTGCRVGLFASMRLDGAVWLGTTKGKAWTRPYIEEDADLVPHLPIPASRIQKFFGRLVAQLQKEKAVKHAYSIHDLRHFCAVREYEDSGHDIEHVRRFLGHANVNTTQIYLRDDLKLKDV